jgi:hypothetical protein
VPDAADALDPTVADRPSTVGGLRGVGEIRAAIDLGTNSFHLIVARVEADGQFDLLTKDKEVVRLGSGAGELRTITPDAIERGLVALARFVRIAEVYGATVDAVGTSALREATNRDEFVRRARDEIGVAVDVVSGAEEARLIHLGVIQTLPVFEERILVVDIGGGTPSSPSARARTSSSRGRSRSAPSVSPTASSPRGWCAAVRSRRVASTCDRS